MMKMKTNRPVNVRLRWLGAVLLVGVLMLGANLQAGFEPGEPLAMLLATDYSLAAEAANPNACDGNERCVEWCDFTNGVIHPTGTLCCVPPDRVGSQVDLSFFCRRPGSGG